ncbi:MAG TPA: 3-ketoacyl-ACP reductase [Kiritimatiellia bacterium]|nr:3-ketoacyl-ACP reductase [Kiritimatiellia bacterium]
MKRVAIVTGGTRGIGFGVAQALARAGFDLCVSGRREAAAVKESLAALESLGAETLYVASDVASAADRAALLDAVRERFGRLHVLVNNAGIAPRERRDVLEATEESFAEVIRVNLQGPYFLTQAAARWMIEQKKADATWTGCIVNVSSISATVASVSRGEYCVSKAGVSMATQLWAVRLGEFDIPVYEVRPGVTATDMTAGVKEKYDTLIADGLCVQRRWGAPEDVGRAVSALASGDFPYSTGQVVMVDGGLTIPRL